jgi:hypothetical protein
MFCRGKSEEVEGGKKHKWLKKLVMVMLVALAVGWYSQQDESKKRFLKHLGKQVPYLPARYYA